jgi:hypothetical protein
METLTPIRFVVYGKPSVQVKDALTGLNPVYMALSEALHDSEFDSAPLNGPPGGRSVATWQLPCDRLARRSSWPLWWWSIQIGDHLKDCKLKVRGASAQRIRPLL